MHITCPYFQSNANLAPNPAHELQPTVPLYLLDCTGCSQTTVRHDNREHLVAALVGTRHGNGCHELTVSADAIGHTSFHTDPTGRTTPSIGYSELLATWPRCLSGFRHPTGLVVSPRRGHGGRRWPWTFRGRARPAPMPPPSMSRRALRIWLSVMIRGRPPKSFLASRRLVIESTTRSRLISCSNCPSAAMIVNSIDPIGVAVSTSPPPRFSTRRPAPRQPRRRRGRRRDHHA